MLKFTVSAPHIDNGAITCLFNNLDLILANHAKILSCKKYRNIKISGLFVGGLYVGMYELSLGDILTLWQTTGWKNDSKYYYNIIGTPLSGMNNTHWYNAITKQFESGSYFNGKSHFILLF